MEKEPNYNGWEKIEKIGGGGQSNVFLARTPKRAEERRKVMGLIKRGGNEEVQARRYYEYARPEKPDELGALKVFKVRENSGNPIERLKREIQILKEGRPNLPRLLDSNADELWMVTEYFSNETLAHYPNKFKNDPYGALVAFRPLVQTISELHADNIVHRDIKTQNIFLSNDGRLIPGDFGLVFPTGPQVRVTLPDERVGPWQHLPRWANLPERIENPTPAIDVYMLGCLLWVMVSGKEWLYGDLYKNPRFDLELTFPNNRSMRLINLVLSQCCGAEENLCVKNAGEVLTVVEEVISTLTKNAPILDENNNVIIPCRFCDVGFYELVKYQGSLRHTILVSDENHIAQNPIFSEIYRCGFCTNIQYFAIGQPDSFWKGKFRSRVNPHSGQKPRAW